jgi:hypothetical protein
MQVRGYLAAPQCEINTVHFLEVCRSPERVSPMGPLCSVLLRNRSLRFTADFPQSPGLPCVNRISAVDQPQNAMLG